MKPVLDTTEAPKTYDAGYNDVPDLAPVPGNTAFDAQQYMLINSSRPAFEERVEVLNYEAKFAGDVTERRAYYLDQTARFTASLPYAIGAGIARGAWNLFADGANLVMDDVPTISDQDLADYAKALPYFGDYYSRNQQSVQLVGDIVGMFVPGLAATKAYKAGSAGLRSAGLATEGTVLGTAGNVLLRSNQNFDDMVAAGRQLAVTEAASTGGLSTLRNAGLFGTKAGQFKRTAFIDGFKDNIAFDIGAYAFYNDSSIYKDLTLGENVAWATGFGIVGGTIDYMRMAKAMRRAATDSGEAAFKVRDPGDLKEFTNEAMARSDTRDLLIASYAARRNANADYVASTEADVLAGRAELNSAKTQVLEADNVQYESVIREQFSEMGKQISYKGVQVSRRFDLESPQLNNLVRMTEQNPAQVLGVRIAEELPSTQSSIVARLGEHEELLAKLKKEADAATEKFKPLQEKLKAAEELAQSMSEYDTKLYESARKQMAETAERHKQLAALDLLVLEADGSANPLKGRLSRMTDDASFEQHIVQVKPKANDSQFEYLHPQLKDFTATNDGYVRLPKFAAKMESSQDVNLIIRQVNGVDTVISVAKLPKAADGNSALLETMAGWASNSKIADDIADATPGLKSAVKNAYVDNANGITQLIKSGATSLDEIRQTFTDFRQQIVQTLGKNNDGTVTVFAVRTKEGLASPRTADGYLEVERMFVKAEDANKNLTAAAKKNGAQVVSVNLPADRILMPGRGPKGVPAVYTTRGAAITDGRILTSTSRMDLGNSSAFTALPHRDAFGVLGTLDVALQKLSQSQWDRLNGITLSEAEHWTRLDYSLGVMDKFKNAAERITFAGADNSVPVSEAVLRETLEWRSLQSKYDDFLDYRQYIAKTENGELSLRNVQSLLNLPSAGEKLHPVMLAFENLYKTGASTLFEGVPDFQQFKLLMGESQNTKLGTSALWGEARMDTRGSFMRFNPSASNATQARNQTKPVLLMREPQSFEGDGDLWVRQQMQARRQDVLDILGNNQGLVGNIFRSLGQLGDFKTAQDISSLANLSTGSRVVGQSNFAYRDSPVMLAVQNLSRRAQQATEAEIGAMLNTPVFKLNINGKTEEFSMAALWGHMQHPANAKSRVGFNAFYQTRRLGWDIDVLSQLDDTGTQYGFTLLNNANNLRIARKFGFVDTAKALEAADANAKILMPAPHLVAGKEQRLIIDKLAAFSIHSLDEFNASVFQNTNTIARAAGKRENIAFKKYWVPPPMIKDGEFAAFVIDPLNKENRHLIIAHSASALQTEIAAQEEIFKAAGAQIVKTYTRKEIDTYAQLMDEAMGGLINYTDTLTQTGGRMSGSTARGAVTESSDLLKYSIQAINKHAQSIPHRTLQLMLEPQIQQARLYSAVNAGKGLGEPYKNYVMEITGRPFKDYANNYVTAVYDGIETGANAFFLWAYDKAGIRPGEWANAIKERIPKFTKTVRPPAEDPTFNPVGSIFNQVSRDVNVATPLKLADITGAMSGIATNLALRFGDAANAIINATSMVVDTPAYIMQIQKMKGETVQEWHRRVGLVSEQLGTQGAAKISPAKLMTSTLHDLYNNAAFKEKLARAAELGTMKPEFFEIERSLFAPTRSYSGQQWKKLGDAVSILSDKSEQFSRYMHMAMGIKLAESFGLRNVDAQINFASKFTDRAIGNYSMRNKPLIFQGPVGMPLGLFQTFVWGKYSRMFEAIENKQYKSLAMQQVLTAGMFGIQAVPGYNVFNGMMTGIHGERTNPVDALNQKLLGDVIARGESGELAYLVSDLLMNGSLSTLSGMSFYTRGDSNISRISTVVNPQDSGGISMMINVAKGIAAAWDANVGPLGLDPERTAEIVATYSPSRPLGRMLEVALGHSVDRSGQIIEEDTRSGLRIAASMLGLRSFDEARQADAYYRDNLAQAQDRRKRDQLNNSLRAMFRNGDFTAKDINTALMAYVEQGGRPEYMPTWFGNQLAESSRHRNYDKVKTAMADPVNGVGDAIRLLAADANYRSNPQQVLQAIANRQ